MRRRLGRQLRRRIPDKVRQLRAILGKEYPAHLAEERQVEYKSLVKEEAEEV